MRLTNRRIRVAIGRKAANADPNVATTGSTRGAGKLAGPWFHSTALGLTGTTTGGVDTGFIREPAGTLNSMRTGGKSYYYLTDATGNVLGLVNDTGTRTHTYSYSPTGTPRTTPTETVVQPYRYAGAYADPTGLMSLADLGEGIGAVAGGVLAAVATAAVCTTGIGCVAVGIGIGALGGGLGASGLKFGLARFL